MANHQARSSERKRRSKLEPYRHLVGKLSDREVASMAGITADGVRMYRQRHDIPPAQTRRNQRRRTHSSLLGAHLNGYLVTVEEEHSQSEYMVLAADLSEAAEKVQTALDGKSGSILGIRYVAPAL